MASKNKRQLYDSDGHLLKQQRYDEVADEFVVGGGITQFTPLLYGEDPRGFNRQIDGGSTRVMFTRTPTASGTFMNTGNVAIAPNGTVGAKGDYLRTIYVEVQAVATGGKAGVFFSQLSDSVFGQGTSGSVIAASTAQTFTSGVPLSASQNSLAGRVISFLYTPTSPGGVAHWFTSRIASHAAISTTSVAVTLEDTPDAGGAPTSWIIHGPKAFRALDPASAAGTYTIDRRFEAENGGFIGWFGSGVVLAECVGYFTG